MPTSAFSWCSPRHQPGNTELVQPTRHRLPLWPHRPHAPGRWAWVHRGRQPWRRRGVLVASRGTLFRFRHAQV